MAIAISEVIEEQIEYLVESLQLQGGEAKPFWHTRIAAQVRARCYSY